MANPITSGTYAFAPDVAELVGEAWERIGFEPETIKARHARSSRRSLNFMFSHWTSLGFKQPWMALQKITLTQGQIQVPLAAPAIDVFHAYLTRSGYDTEMYPISETDYEAIPNKTQQGRPTMYWTNYAGNYATTPPGGVNNNGTPTVFIWQASQNSTDIINLACLSRAQDAGQANMGLFIPYTWYEAVASALAARLAQKYRPDRYEALMIEAYGGQWQSGQFMGGKFGDAMRSSRDKSPTRFRARFRM